MLNEVIALLRKQDVLDLLGRERARELVLEMTAVSRKYDCNPNEILDGHGSDLGIGRYRLEPAERLNARGLTSLPGGRLMPRFGPRCSPVRVGGRSPGRADLLVSCSSDTGSFPPWRSSS